MIKCYTFKNNMKKKKVLVTECIMQTLFEAIAKRKIAKVIFVTFKGMKIKQM